MKAIESKRALDSKALSKSTAYIPSSGQCLRISHRPEAN
jgi:hypothetical protein